MSNLRNLITLFLILVPITVFACGGEDTFLNDSGKILNKKIRNSLNYTDVNFMPEDAFGILLKALQNSRFKGEEFVFRKAEYVHGKLVYQFESKKYFEDVNAKYHFGPVNQNNHKIRIDVDAMTGNVYLASGCGGAPSQKVYTPTRFEKYIDFGNIYKKPFIQNNTGFISFPLNKQINIDGRLNEKAWENAMTQYFYTGKGKNRFYTEVKSYYDNTSLYFGVKTDSPYWLSLLFKEDPNMGMMWEYKDAFLMKSDGSVTDAHFAQKKDESYYLKRDTKSRIEDYSASQNGLYTYEFKIRLSPDDNDEDVSFAKNNDYSAVLMMGNTKEHYGLFTLDDAHKDHEHSKANKNHVNVQASSEEIFRIGGLPDKNLFGENIAVNANMLKSSFLSSYNPAKRYTQLSYTDTAKKFSAGITSFFIILTGSFIFLLFKKEKTGRSFFYEKILRSRYFHLIFTLPTVLIFLLIGFTGFFGEQLPRENLATVITWIIWWNLLVFSIILAGRLWCRICPFALFGDMIQKLHCFNKKLPKIFRNYYLQITLFVVLTYIFVRFGIDKSPFYTAVLLIVFTITAGLFSLIYKRRTFCRYVCPIGGALGIYSVISPVQIERESDSTCSSHNQKSCIPACRTFENPVKMQNSVYCDYCMKCFTACEKNNLQLSKKRFGVGSALKTTLSSSETVGSYLLFGVVLVQTLSMTSVKTTFEKFISSIIGSQWAFETFFFLTVLIPLLSALLIFGTISLFSRNTKSKKEILSKLSGESAIALIPLSLGLHLSHNFSHLVEEIGLVVPGIITGLQKLGAPSSLYADFNVTPAISSAASVFSLQSVFMAGFASVSIYVLKKRNLVNKSGRIFIAAGFILLSILLVYVLSLPMAGGHVH